MKTSNALKSIVYQMKVRIKYSHTYYTILMLLKPILITTNYNLQIILIATTTTTIIAPDATCKLDLSAAAATSSFLQFQNIPKKKIICKKNNFRYAQ